MAEFLVLCIPTLAYLLVRRRQPGKARRTMGLRWGQPLDYVSALAAAVALGVAGWLAVSTIPREVLHGPGTTGRITGAGALAGVVLRAVGEEVFFRGFLAGLLVKRFGFTVGNLAQAVLFLLPHLLLLTVSPAFWALLPVQFASGWVMGWLRHRHDSIGPPSLTHVLLNVATGLSG